MREIDGFYGEVHNDLKALIGEIDVKNGELSKVREGKTSVKRKGIEELIASIVPVANATKAYAVRKKKIGLKALTDFSERQFKRLSHAELPIKVKNIGSTVNSVKMIN